MARVILGKAPVNFTEVYRWDFNGTLEGFVSANADLAINGTYMGYLTTEVDHILMSPTNLNFDGSAYTQVRIRLKRTQEGTGNPWSFQFYFESTGTPFSGTHSVFVNPEPDWSEGYQTININMSNVGLWTNETIKRIRFDILQGTPGAEFHIDSIVVDDGGLSPPPSYHRGGKTGLFVSKPGANVLSCSDGDLLFDSTVPNFKQVISAGTVTVPAGVKGDEGDLVYPTTLSIDTNVSTNEYYNNPQLDWNLFIPASNLHSTAYSSSWNTSLSEGSVRVPSYMSTNFNNNKKSTSIYGNPISISLLSTGLSVYTIAISNKSLNEQTISWTMYRE
jgi:hypothetical protein